MTLLFLGAFVYLIFAYQNYLNKQANQGKRETNDFSSELEVTINSFKESTTYDNQAQSDSEKTIDSSNLETNQSESNIVTSIEEAEIIETKATQDSERLPEDQAISLTSAFTEDNKKQSSNTRGTVQDQIIAQSNSQDVQSEDEEFPPKQNDLKNKKEVVFDFVEDEATDILENQEEIEENY